MKTSIFKFAAIAMMMAGCFSCTSKMNEVDEEVTDPETAILGKWELVEKIDCSRCPEKKHTPNGYVEYLTDGCFGWYDYTTKEYILYETKYWLDKVLDFMNDNDIPKDYWSLHYETTLIELDNGVGGKDTCRVGPDYPDKPLSNNCQLEFINHNTMKLFLHGFGGNIEFIYKRKK